MDTVHRFADPEYAELSLHMRTGTQPGAVFDQLASRGQIVLHEDDAARAVALAGEAATTGALVVTDTREQVADLNAVIRDRLVATARVDDTRVVITQAGERIGTGDRVATRRNDYDLGIANRDTWTVTSIDDDGTLHLASGRSSRAIPFNYAALHVELAYCATAYGAQGETTHTAHLALGEHTGAASAYVAMTRGRHTNTAHLVAENIEDARRQWIEVFNRDRADLGPAHAARLATEEAGKYLSGPPGLNRYVPNDRPAVPDRAPRTDGRRTDPRSPVEPPPSPWKTPDRGPGIGF
ncbi:MAG: hypothetical protein H7288_18535 [Kineosporiaceae bacterium]|nr:hypothetical protein [Aeromicrobium sp.]